MVMTTFLNAHEIDQILPDPSIQTLLDEVRKLTGEDWQIVYHPMNVRGGLKTFFKLNTVDLYSLYVYVGGIGPYQCINFYSSPEEFSINTLVGLDTISNYLMGIVTGFRCVEFKKLKSAV
jgi:hypothetical protein